MDNPTRDKLFEASAQLKFLMEPYEYMVKKKGTNFRAKMNQAFNKWLRIPDDMFQVTDEISEILHNVVLLSDDMLDNSQLRRGSPVAQRVYGWPATINASYYVYFIGLEKILKYFPDQLKQKAVEIYVNYVLTLHRGQGLDIRYRDMLTCPTEQQYLDMIELKTSTAFSVCMELMQLFSEDKRDYNYLCSLLGWLYQIRDDYANLTMSQYEDSKGFCEDLHEGKFSFPIVHAINANPGDSTLKNIIKQRTNNREMKQLAVEYLERSGSFDYTVKVLVEYRKKFMDEVERLGGNEELIQLLGCLSDV